MVEKARKHEHPGLKVRNLTAQFKFSGNQNSVFRNITPLYPTHIA